MSWKRQKSTVFAKPEEPSFALWLMLGVVALVGSVMLFVLHANQLAGPLQEFNIWIAMAGPLVVWFFFLCLRGWIYNSAFDRHEFEKNEAEYAQQQWTNWAGRNIAVLRSGVMLPENLAPKLILTAPPTLEQNTRLTKHLHLFDNKNHFSTLLSGLDYSLTQIPAGLPFGVTLLTDSSDDAFTLQAEFNDSWLSALSGHPLPALNIVTSKSFIAIDDRIKSPTLDVELVLIHQMQGREVYSDALALLLLTSDDVATKYHLSYYASLLRPMPLESTKNLSVDLDTFFSTQSQANKTGVIIGDGISWGNEFATLLASAKKYGGSWKTQQLHWLEEYTGCNGPFSPWVMAAVVSDIVNIQKADCLMLSSDGENTFINTVQTGNINNDNR